MKRRIRMCVDVICDAGLPNAEVRRELLEAELRANEGMVVRLHFELPDDVKHDEPPNKA
jgi:hypothetical protein